MLTSKYKPSKMKEIVGHTTAIKQITDFLNNYKKGKALLIYGSTGIGKTILSKVIANDNKLSFMEAHSSDIEEIRKIKSSSKMVSLFGKGKIILIDEIDNYTDRNTVSEILDIIKTSSFPVILTADDAYDKRIKKIREACELMPLRRINSYSVIKKLKDICDKEMICVPEDVLDIVAGSANGDLRAAINDLEILSANRKKISTSDVVGFREREINIFDTLKTIFKSNSLSESLKAIDYCDKDLQEIFWWVEQNVTNEFNDPRQIALAYDILSRADLFREKTMDNANFRMVKYMKMLIASITLIRGEADSGFTSYKPPQRLLILGRTKIERAEENDVQNDIAKYLHCSRRCIKNQMPYLNMLTMEPSTKEDLQSVPV